MNKTGIEINYSRVSAESIRAEILPKYGLSEKTCCQFFMLGLHDNYIIKDEVQKYILRLYRNDWRSREELGFELDLLLHIKQHCNTVAAPIVTTDGGYFTSIDCPEGDRYAALFPFADGCAPGNKLVEDEALLLGKTVANIHACCKDFRSNYARQDLTLSYLLDKSVEIILPVVNRRQGDVLVEIMQKIHQKMPKLPAHWPYVCACSGDVNASNFHISGTKIVLFDFDQCGMGWRAFEIGKFIASILSRDETEVLQKAFLAGYQSISRLSDDELASIPYFICVAIIWVMAIHVYNVHLLGVRCLDELFWDKRFELLTNNIPWQEHDF